MQKSLQKIFLFYFLLIIFTTPNLTLGQNSSGNMINVLIKESCGQIKLSCNDWLEIHDDSGELFKLYGADLQAPIIIEPYALGIKINELEINSMTLYLKSSQKKPIKFDKLSYRGVIIIRLNSHWKLDVINKLDLYSYLCGIMKSEISPNWSVETLKAQAIIARTYALREISFHKYEGYNLKASTESQVYSGIAGEDPRTNLAIKETENLVLTMNGELFPAFYHACCGGKTALAQNVFEDYPSVISVNCGYCDASPHFTWQFIISPVELRNILLRNKYRAYPINSIKILDRYSSNRVKELIIKFQNTIDSPYKQLLIKGCEFRKLLGYNLLRSTNLNLEFVDDVFIFQGNGWGHGVGLCQWGAKQMGKEGATFIQILKKYYPFAEIKHWDFKKLL